MSRRPHWHSCDKAWQQSKAGFAFHYRTLNAEDSRERFWRDQKDSEGKIMHEKRLDIAGYRIHLMI